MAASEEPRDDDRRMGDLLREIDRRSTSQAKAAEGTASEHVTRVPITEALYIAAKNISEDDAKLVEELAAEYPPKLGVIQWTQSRRPDGTLSRP